MKARIPNQNNMSRNAMLERIQKMQEDTLPNLKFIRIS